MGNGIWDHYGNWDQIAEAGSIVELERKITGVTYWTPNYLAPGAAAIVKKHAQGGSVSDFGCGLGRNVEMLRSNFERPVFGVDRPAMLSRMDSDVRKSYNGLFTELNAAIDNDRASILYDSVVFQHFIDHDYISYLADTICLANGPTVILSLSIESTPNPVINKLNKLGWSMEFEEVESISFGCPHISRVIVKRE